MDGYTSKGSNCHNCLSFEKVSTLKGKNSKGRILFLLDWTPFQGFDEQERSQEVTKVVSLIKMAENLPDVSSPPMVCYYLNSEYRIYPKYSDTSTPTHTCSKI